MRSSLAATTWRKARVADDPQLMSVLWALRSGDFRHVGDFQGHVGDALPIQSLLEQLETVEFVASHHGVYTLTPEGNELVSRLREGHDAAGGGYRVVVNARRLAREHPAAAESHIFDKAFLPLPMTFVGRLDELDWLLTHLAPGSNSAVVSLSGLGGIGKTTLAGMAVHFLLQDGVYDPADVQVIRCEDVREPVYALQRILATREHPWRIPQGGTVPVLQARAAELFAHHRVLLVLDNIEPTLNIQVVATALRDAGANVLLIARHTIEIPNGNQLVLGPLSSAESLALFAYAMGLSGSDVMTPEQRVQVERIVDGLQRHTYAVQLAGTHVQVSGQLIGLDASPLSTPDWTLELADDTETRTLARVFAESIERLPHEARRLFAALAAFDTLECGVHAVAAVGEALAIENVGALLDLLAQRTLVELYEITPSEMPGGGDAKRVLLHPLLAAMARREYTGMPPEDRQRAKREVAEYYLEYARQVREPTLYFDQYNIVGALQWAFEHHLDATVLGLCSAMHAFWYNRWCTRQAVEWLPRAVEAGMRLRAGKTLDKRDLKALADTMLTHAKLRRRLGDLAQATQELVENFDLHREIDDVPGQAAVLAEQAIVFRIQGRLGQAEATLRTSIDLRHEANDIHGEAHDLSQMGRIMVWRGKLEEAESNLERSLVLADRVGDLRTKAIVRIYLGQVARMRGKLRAAEKHIHEGMRLMADAGDRRGQAVALHQLGIIYKTRGEYAPAREYFERSLDIRREVDDHRGVGEVLGYLGKLARHEGNLAEAHRYFTESLDIAQRVGDRRGEGIVRSQLGRLAWARQDYKEAARLFQRSLEIHKEVANRRGEGADRGFLGRMALEQGKLDEAQRWLRESLNIAREVGDKQGEGIVLGALGKLAEKQQRLGEAERYLHRALSIAKSIGSAPDMAKSLMDLGQFEIEQQHNPDEGRKLLVQAVHTYAALGSPLAEPARQQATVLGIKWRDVQ